MHSFKALPLKRVEIRDLAMKLRKELGLEGHMWFPILEVVEQAFPELDKNFYFQVVEKDELGSSHGLTIREGNTTSILLRDDVYDRAYDGEGRDRGTVAHEVGHYLMHVNCPALHRHFGGELRTFEDPEWQAKCFQGELLVPKELVKGMGASEAAHQCGVSIEAATYQLNLYNSGK